MRCLLFLIASCMAVFSVPDALSAQSRNAVLPQDSLTTSLCNNQEQIVSQRSGDFRIEYYMGDTQLNMKTMKGFLILNGASLPYYRKFKTQRVLGLVCFVGGIGAIVADGYISKPSFPILSIGGAGISIGGLVAFFKANDKFRMAIYQYNRDICNLN